MAALITLSELSVWTRQEIEDDDEWAVAVMAAASEVVRSAAKQPTWQIGTAPVRARQIACHLAARTYLNPDSVVGEGNIGPLGGDRYVESLATALHLTPAERDELAALAPAGASGGGGLWVQPVVSGNPVEETDVYLFDHTGSDWGIPYAPAEQGWIFGR